MVRKCYNEDQVEWSPIIFKHPDLTIAYSAIGGMVGISNPSTAAIKSHKEETLQSLRTTESRMESFNDELLGSGVTTTLSTTIHH